MGAPSPRFVRTTSGYRESISSATTTAPLFYPEIMSPPPPVLHANGTIAVDGEDHDTASLCSSRNNDSPPAAAAAASSSVCSSNPRYSSPTTAAETTVTQHQEQFSSPPRQQQQHPSTPVTSASTPTSYMRQNNPESQHHWHQYPVSHASPSPPSVVGSQARPPSRPSEMGSQARPPSHIGVAYDDDDSSTIVSNSTYVFNIDVQPGASTTPMSGITTASFEAKEKHQPDSSSSPPLVQAEYYAPATTTAAYVTSSSNSSSRAVAPASPSANSSAASSPGQQQQQQRANTPQPLRTQPIPKSPSSASRNRREFMTAEEYLGSTRDMAMIHCHETIYQENILRSPQMQRLKSCRKGATVVAGVAGGIAGLLVLGPIGAVAGGVGCSTATRIVGKRIEKRQRNKLADAQAGINLKWQSETSSFS